MGSFKVLLETTTFSDLSAIGAGSPKQRGDASEFQMWVCFTLSEENQRIWLTSSELGGRERIDGIVAELLSAQEAESSDCPELSSPFKPVRLDSGVWLGSTSQEIELKFGEGVREGDTVYFSWHRETKGYDVMSNLFVNFSDGKVSRLHAGHSTTN